MCDVRDEEARRTQTCNILTGPVSTHARAHTHTRLHYYRITRHFTLMVRAKQIMQNRSVAKRNRGSVFGRSWGRGESIWRSSKYVVHVNSKLGANVSGKALCRGLLCQDSRRYYIERIMSPAPQGSPRTPVTCIAATTPGLIVRISKFWF